MNSFKAFEVSMNLFPSYTLTIQSSSGTYCSELNMSFEIHTCMYSRKPQTFFFCVYVYKWYDWYIYIYILQTCSVFIQLFKAFLFCHKSHSFSCHWFSAVINYTDRNIFKHITFWIYRKISLEHNPSEDLVDYTVFACLFLLRISSFPLTMAFQ